MKKRWKIGSYIAKYNPKSFSGSLEATGKTTTTVNGLVSTNNLFFDEAIDLTIDIYQKPTAFDIAPFKTITANYYSSIAEKRMTYELYCLRGTTIDLLSTSGSVARSIGTVVSSGGTAVSLTETDLGIAVFHSNRSLVVQDENSVQIGKYTYSDTDFNDIVGITAQYGTHNVFAINKYGKIFRLYDNSSTYDLVYQFPDFDANKLATKAVYNSIHMVDTTYIGVVSNTNKIMYFNPTFDIVHATEFASRSIKDMSFGNYSYNFRLLETNQITKASIDYCGVDVDKVKSQISNGTVAIVDDNNIVYTMLVNRVSVNRVRNKQDARYEISISGKLM